MPSVPSSSAGAPVPAPRALPTRWETEYRKQFMFFVPAGTSPAQILATNLFAPPPPEVLAVMYPRPLPSGSAAAGYMPPHAQVPMHAHAQQQQQQPVFALPFVPNSPHVGTLGTGVVMREPRTPLQQHHHQQQQAPPQRPSSPVLDHAGGADDVIDSVVNSVLAQTQVQVAHSATAGASAAVADYLAQSAPPAGARRAHAAPAPAHAAHTAPAPAPAQVAVSAPAAAAAAAASALAPASAHGRARPQSAAPVRRRAKSAPRARKHVPLEKRQPFFPYGFRNTAPANDKYYMFTHNTYPDNEDEIYPFTITRALAVRSYDEVRKTTAPPPARKTDSDDEDELDRGAARKRAESARRFQLPASNAAGAAASAAPAAVAIPRQTAAPPAAQPAQALSAAATQQQQAGMMRTGTAGSLAPSAAVAQPAHATPVMQRTGTAGSLAPSAPAVSLAASSTTPQATRTQQPPAPVAPVMMPVQMPVLTGPLTPAQMRQQFDALAAASSVARAQAGVANAGQPGVVFLAAPRHEYNPQRFKFLPVALTWGIPPAGVSTELSEPVGALLNEFA